MRRLWGYDWFGQTTLWQVTAYRSFMVKFFHGIIEDQMLENHRERAHAIVAHKLRQFWRVRGVSIVTYRIQSWQAELFARNRNLAYNRNTVQFYNTFESTASSNQISAALFKSNFFPALKATCQLGKMESSFRFPSAVPYTYSTSGTCPTKSDNSRANTLVCWRDHYSNSSSNDLLMLWRSKWRKSLCRVLSKFSQINQCIYRNPVWALIPLKHARFYFKLIVKYLTSRPLMSSHHLLIAAIEQARDVQK